jgi:DNA repair photolyase
MQEEKKTEISVKTVETKDYLTKSNLPSSDYVINPYIGCSHGCKYCYASFMKRFTGHSEEWGEFIDVKRCGKPLNLKKLKGKSVFISSVTDCYNKYEETFRVTRRILEQLVDADCSIRISTKSNLILRDMDILKRFKKLKVSMSINTLDEGFRSDMDNASSIEDRLLALEEMHGQGIFTFIFISPIFPFITDFRSIIEVSRTFACEYWFENLNLRGSYKNKILSYIMDKYPDLYDSYERIYIKRDRSHWAELALEISEYCKRENIAFTNYFNHEELVKIKLANEAKL